MRTPEQIIQSLEKEINYLNSEMERLESEFRPLEELYDSYTSQAAEMQAQLDYYKKVYDK